MVNPLTHFILPVGTQVVALTAVRGGDGVPALPRGSIGVITQSPSDYSHSYRVRFAEDFEVSLKRQDRVLLTKT